MSGGRHSYSWRWNRESKQAESIGLIKLLSSWKTRWAAVALPLPLLLLCRRLFSLPYPDCQASWPPLSPTSWWMAGQPRPHSPATSSAPSISLRSSVELVVDDRSLSESFDVLFIRIPCRLYTVLFAVVLKEVSSPRGESWTRGRHDDSEFPWFPHVVRRLFNGNWKNSFVTHWAGSRFELTLKLSVMYLFNYWKDKLVKDNSGKF